ncbi:hypothetical protein [Rickettsia endosymbiont of Culicoides newsteadi]|nr:hypothetical protein [Rickettsia endosymbiont of Culicoides newsteadi]
MTFLKDIVNSGEFGARNDGVTPISNRQATSDEGVFVKLCQVKKIIF